MDLFSLESLSRRVYNRILEWHVADYTVLCIKVKKKTGCFPSLGLFFTFQNPLFPALLSAIMKPQRNSGNG